jgi:type IV pilus assembly protein PilB
LMVAMSDPLDFVSMDDLRFRTGLEVGAAVATESSILSSIERYYKVEEAVENILRLGTDSPDVEFLKEEDEGDAPQALQQLSQAAPIVKLVTTIMMDAIRRRATDIHIEPRETHVQVRYRVDGNLQDTLKLPKRVQASVVSRIKILGNMDIANRMSPQDGSTKMRYDKKSVDLRISTLPAVFGEKVVIRILDKSKGLLPLPKLGVPDSLIKKLQEAGSRSQGMILVTGPTGSGKTTTLYAFLQWLQDPAINIITVEDPVEYSIPGITQVSVREQAGLGFAAFMKSALRQDPDVILVGEVRDLETAEIAIRAALTGHFVLTTLHTNDTVATVVRLIDLGVQPFLVSSSLSGVVAQRLVRRICDHCRVEVPYPDSDLPPDFPRLSRCYKGRGCPHCDYSGFHGQVGVYEYLDVSSQLKRLIANNAPEGVLREEAVKMGMVSLFQDAWQKVADGTTTITEVMGKVPYYGSLHHAAVHVPEAPESKTETREIGATVVLVDSDPADVSLFQSAFDSQGYRLVVSEWASAYETVCRENPDAIVLNLDQSEADWRSLGASLQSSLSTVTIPVLLLKSDTEWTMEVESLQQGAAGVLHRPLEPVEVLARLDNALKLAV